MTHAAAIPEPWLCATCGASVDKACAEPGRGCRIDAELVSMRLEEAGSTLIAMRVNAPGPAPYRCALPEPVRAAVESYGWDTEPNRAATPSAACVSRMDGAYAWLALIPQNRYVLRRIVAGRSLVSPTTGKHLLSWKRVAVMLRCDYRAVQRWHGQGIEAIVDMLITKT